MLKPTEVIAVREHIREACSKFKTFFEVSQKDVFKEVTDLSKKKF